MHSFKRIAFAGVSIAALAAASPVVAQQAVTPATKADGGTGAAADNALDIVVTARRIEERLQDVPISITAFNQQQLSAKNIVNPTDLATYTPSLNTSSIFNSDLTSYAIRGFVQDIGTAPSVGVYFDDVVAPRGGQLVNAGDGAGPGMFFDLQNVQVLKGPQGTLFGRNTTGGAVLLVPARPTDRFEGYVEGSYGTHDMKRFSGVLNLPASDRARFRLSVDHLDRNGYTKNPIGPALDDRNYTSVRLSADIDLAPDLNNYTVAYYSHSRSHGGGAIINACNPSVFPFGQSACTQLAAQEALGSVRESQNDNPSPLSVLQEWGIINTTRWTISDDVVLKNIASYAQLRQDLRGDLFGTNFKLPAVLNVPVGGGIVFPVPTGPLAGTPIAFTELNAFPNGHSSDQETYTDEIQLQGHSFGGNLNWQTGFYFERSTPLSANTGTLAASALTCQNAVAFQCTDTLGLILGQPVGGLASYRVSTSYRDIGTYAQGTYKLTSTLSLTGGIRYTWDTVTANSNLISYTFPLPNTPVAACVKSTASLANNCRLDYKIDNKAPTWIVDLDYKPIKDVLIYAKYSRGYRQGNVAVTSAEGYETFRPEHVDAYEAGAKTSFGGSLRGHFDIAAFYNNLRDQQLSVGFFPKNPTVPEAEGKVNAGKSRTYGVEIDAGLSPVSGLTLNLGYAYLRTKLLSFSPIVIPPTSIFGFAQPNEVVGGPLVYSPRNKVTVDAHYRLPLDAGIGAITVGGNYVWTDKQQSNVTAYGTLPSFGLVNLDMSWNGIAGMPIDLQVFATNVTNKVYAIYDTGLIDTVGYDARRYGEPRMVGARLRYHFGG